MKWKGRRHSSNVEDGTNDPQPNFPDGVRLTDGTIYRKPKAPNKTVKVNKDIEFNPGDEKEMAVVQELALKQAEGKTPIPTPRPIIKTQVTPGKWKTKTNKK